MARVSQDWRNQAPPFGEHAKRPASQSGDQNSADDRLPVPRVGDVGEAEGQRLKQSAASRPEAPAATADSAPRNAVSSDQTVLTGSRRPASGQGCSG